jgi:hypothetical protein
MPSNPNRRASLLSDREVRNAVHTQVEEGSSSLVTAPPANPEPVPESKAAAEAESPKKKVVDPLRPSKLSLLPPDPPELPSKGSAGTASDAAYDVPPPPPPVPRKSSEGPALPSADPASK